MCTLFVTSLDPKIAGNNQTIFGSQFFTNYYGLFVNNFNTTPVTQTVQMYTAQNALSTTLLSAAPRSTGSDVFPQPAPTPETYSKGLVIGLGCAGGALLLGLIALSLTFLGGYGGMVSLAQMSVAGMAGYAVAVLGVSSTEISLGWPWWVAVPFAVLIASACATVIGWLSVRTEGIYTIMITLAFGQMAFFTASSLAAYGGDDGYTLYDRTEIFGTRLMENRLFFHYLCLAFLLFCWAICAMLLASRFGRVLRAVRENPLRAQAVGFAPYPYRLLAYVIAGTLAGLAGVLFANATEFVAPAYMSWQRSGELIFMVILGGLGRLSGAILGAVFFVLLETWLPSLTTHWKMIFGPLLILAVLFMRGGLIGFLGARRG
jgi:branched-chain amino acid transport system permease protein